MRRFFLPLLLLLLLFAILLTALDKFPSFWWDEGWTLNVARTLVERGYYAQWLNGQPAPPGQSAAFPAVFSVAFAFQMTGTGLWQARFVIVLYTLATFAILYALGTRLYNSRTAMFAVLATLIFFPHLEIHPLYLGHQVLAEMLMLFFLLLGYLFCFGALAARNWLWLGAIAFWALGLVSKAQPLPFWLGSLLAAAMFCALHHRWRQALGILVAMFATVMVVQGLSFAPELLLGQRALPSMPTPGLVQVSAFVTDLGVRARVLLILLVFGLPTLLGLTYAAWRWFETSSENFARRVTQLMLFAFAASWFAWYALLSVGSLRYLFPAAFVATIFLGALIDDAVWRFDWRTFARERKLNSRALAALGVAILGGLYLMMTWQQVSQITVSPSFAKETTAWLNANVSAQQLIESYEPEIFFGLKPRIHYPPDTLNVEVIRAREIDPSFVLTYDASAFHPDYIVVGRFGRLYHIYANVLEKGTYAAVETLGDYTIYRRQDVVQ